MFKKFLMILGGLTLAAIFLVGMAYLAGWYLMHNTPFGA